MPKGIDIRQTTGTLGLRAFLQDSSGALVTTGTCHLRLFELQESGTLKTYDWASHTFKYPTVSVENTGMVHQSGNNNARATAIWTTMENTLSGFNVGSIYFAQVEHSGASPAIQTREFQFGEMEGNGINAVADGFLTRDLSAVTGEASRSPINALRFLRNKWAVTGTTLVVYEEDDTTIAWSGSLSTTSSGNQITGNDPS